MADAPLLPIIAEISIAAPLEHVWTVLTGHDFAPAWLGCLDYKPEVGATFHMQPDAAKREAGDTSGASSCGITLMQPPHKFDFSWSVPGAPETSVQISLFSEGAEHSFVRLIHAGWEQFPRAAAEDVYAQLKAEWEQRALADLKRIAERRR